MSNETVDLARKYFKLSAIVDTVLTIDLDLSVSHFFQKYLTAAKWYYVQLSVNHVQDVKTELLDVSDVLTVTLPVHAVMATKIGEPWGQYVRTLGVNADLSLADRTLGNPEFIYTGSPDMIPNGTNVLAYGGYEFANYGGRSLFSIGGGLPSKGFYKMRTCEDGVKELMLDVGVCTSQVYVEYITTGLNPCGETICTPSVGEAVRKYLNHHFEKTRRDGGKTEAAIFRTGKELYHAEAIVKATRNDLDPEALTLISRKYYRLTNKI
jgi:hypothetical protein